jgi:hypothetical protein
MFILTTIKPAMAAANALTLKSMIFGKQGNKVA